MGSSSTVDFDQKEFVTQDPLYRLGTSHLFQYLCLGMILLNSTFMGVEVNIRVGRLVLRTTGQVSPLSGYGDEFLTYLYGFELFLIVWMFLELSVNLWVMKVNRGDGWRWNLFDTAILIGSVALLVGDGTGNMSVMRLGRLYKIFRIVRIMKMSKFLSMFHQLNGVRKMVLSIVGSLTSLMWALLLITIIMYIVSVIFMQGIEGFLEQELGAIKLEALQADDGVVRRLGLAAAPHDGVGRRLTAWQMYPDEGASQAQTLSVFYGTVGTSMLTLFRAISGGTEWTEAAAAIGDVGDLYMAVWIAFIGFTLFGILNVLTGVFCDAAMKAAQADTQMRMDDMKDEARKCLKTLRRCFAEADTDSSGFLSKSEFEAVVTHPTAHVEMESLGIDVEDATELFECLDPDRTNMISIDDFIFGCMKVKGGAKSVDIVTLLLDSRRLKSSMEEIKERLKLVTSGTYLPYLPAERISSRQADRELTTDVLNI